MIDVHTHIFSQYVRDHRDELARQNPVFSLIYSNKQARMIGVDELRRSMEQEGVESSVSCGFPWDAAELCRRENDYLMECSQKYPQIIIPFISLPRDPTEAISELERCAQEGAPGVGELAPGTYGDELWNLDSIRPVCDAIREKGLPVLVHCNEPVGHPYPGKGHVRLGQMQSLVQALQGIHVILAHMGGGFIFYELMPEIAAMCQRVYYDTAAIPLIYDTKVYRTAISIVGSERILFGSDYPLLSPGRYVREMQEAGLNEAESRNILESNAKALLFGAL